mmetsp:Transcript_2474/g.8428  ORF Transcript_2474/g.8428 Transcript_2474/m.8428 type:complete len:442 (+) Transcript_2474:662-1987(+)
MHSPRRARARATLSSRAARGACAEERSQAFRRREHRGVVVPDARHERHRVHGAPELLLERGREDQAARQAPRPLRHALARDVEVVVAAARRLDRAVTRVRRPQQVRHVALHVPLRERRLAARAAHRLLHVGVQGLQAVLPAVVVSAAARGGQGGECERRRRLRRRETPVSAAGRRLRREPLVPEVRVRRRVGGHEPHGRVVARGVRRAERVPLHELAARAVTRDHNAAQLGERGRDGRQQRVRGRERRHALRVARLLVRAGLVAALPASVGRPERDAGRRRVVGNLEVRRKQQQARVAGAPGGRGGRGGRAVVVVCVAQRAVLHEQRVGDDVRGRAGQRRRRVDTQRERRASLADDDGLRRGRNAGVDALRRHHYDRHHRRNAQHGRGGHASPLGARPPPDSVKVALSQVASLLVAANAGDVHGPERPARHRRRRPRRDTQ